MNFYALNVTPVNGWETHFGSGAATQAVTGTASLQQAVTARAEGTVRVSATASATYGVLGSAFADLRLEIAPSTGNIMMRGRGGAAMALQGDARSALLAFAESLVELSLSAMIDGRSSAAIKAPALMVLSASGEGRLRRYASGKAPLALSIDPTGHHVEVRQFGYAAMSLSIADAELKKAVTGDGYAQLNLGAGAAAILRRFGHSHAPLVMQADALPFLYRFGHVNAPMVLSVSPTEHYAIIHQYGHAAMSMDAQAELILGVLGAGEAGMTLGADATAILRRHGFGIAPMELTITPPDHYVEIHQFGHAQMELTGVSYEQLATTGQAPTNMRLTIKDDGRLAAVGKVDALMELIGRYTIPYPPRAPLIYSPAHPTTTMRQPHEARVLTATPDRNKMRSSDSQSVRITRREPCSV